MKRCIILFLSLLFLTSCSKNEKQDSTVLPPKTDFTKSLIESLGDNKIVNKQNEFQLYFKSGSYSEQHVDQMVSSARAAITRVKNIMEISVLKEGFYLIMIDSRQEMEKLIDRNVKALASGRNDAAIFVHNESIRPYFKHELFHLIAFNIWGEPAERILDEGGAMYSDNQCLQYSEPLSTINKYLFENEMWFDLTELVNNFNEKARENDLIAYLQAGYLFKFLYENYGLEKMKDLWKSGFESFENIYGFDLIQLDTRIEEQIERVKYTEVNWEELMYKGCG